MVDVVSVRRLGEAIKSLRRRKSQMYQECADRVEDALLSGQVKPGEVVEFASALLGGHTSPEDVELIASELVYRGVLVPQYTRAFRQFVVSSGNRLGVLGGILSLTKEALKRGMTPGVKVLSFDIVPAWRYLAAKLEIEVGEPVVIVDRLRLVDGEPVALETSSMPQKYVPGVTKKMFEGKGADQSSFDLLEKKFGIRLERAVDIVAAVPVGKREAELLAMEEGEPILLRERTTWDEKGRLAKWSRAFFKARSQYELELR
ncbi:MAG: GntR family transcriptional regulator [Anaerolineae bacterium]